MTKLFLALFSLITLQGPLGLSAWVEPSNDWQIVSYWKQNKDNYYSIILENKKISGECQNEPDSYVDFPTVIIASHEIYADNMLIKVFSDEKFKKTRSFYGSPSLECSKILLASSIKWKVTTVLPYFAKIKSYPRLLKSKPNRNLVQETFNVIAFGGLLLLALINYIVFYGKLRNTIVFRSVLSCLFMALYFLGTVSGVFNIDLDIFYVHKFTDLSMWIGGYMYYSIFRVDNYFNKKIYVIHEVLIAIGAAVIVFSPSILVTQIGTSLPFPLTVLATPLLMFDLFKQLDGNYFSKEHILKISSLGIFIFGVVNDISVISGASSNYTFLAAAALAAHIFLTLSVHEKILETYSERDHLRDNLKEEVEAKTLELKETQGELVQSAKLASLGTLSAGIAHEINNSLNYVNGSIRPLEKIIAKVEDEKLQAKANNLLDLMKDGLKLTFDIIKSLRNYTGLNQAKMRDVNISEVLVTVQNLLLSKLRHMEVEVDIDPDIEVYGDTVSLNQVFMNLISNAADAMNETGVLKVRASEEDDKVKICIEDSGKGISPEGLTKIFDPFYTTKDVGQGTGLGLHICKKEIEKHGGEINVKSVLGEGTTFSVILNKVRQNSDTPSKGEDPVAA